MEREKKHLDIFELQRIGEAAEDKCLESVMDAIEAYDIRAIDADVTAMGEAILTNVIRRVAERLDADPVKMSRRINNNVEEAEKTMKKLVAEIKGHVESIADIIVKELMEGFEDKAEDKE